MKLYVASILYFGSDDESCWTREVKVERIHTDRRELLLWLVREYRALIIPQTESHWGRDQLKDKAEETLEILAEIEAAPPEKDTLLLYYALLGAANLWHFEYFDENYEVHLREVECFVLSSSSTIRTSSTATSVDHQCDATGTTGRA